MNLQHSATVSNVIEPHCGTITKVTQLCSATGIKLIEKHFVFFSNDCLFSTLFIAMLSFQLYLLINIFHGQESLKCIFQFVTYCRMAHPSGRLIRNVETDVLSNKDAEPKGVCLCKIKINYNQFELPNVLDLLIT